MTNALRACCLFLVLLVGVPPRASAQCDRWETGLGYGGLDESANTFCAFDDGTGTALYAGGAFTQVGGLETRGIASWQKGSWTEVGGGIDRAGPAFVGSLAVFDDGSRAALYACGLFTRAGQAQALNVAKWNGTAWSALGSGLGGVNAAGRALCVYDDGSGPALYAAGQFTTAGSAQAKNIARWNGVAWQALSVPFPGTSAIDALCAWDDGSGLALYVGTSNALGNAILRWNGQAWSTVGSGLSGGINSLAVRPVPGSGTVLVAAGFLSLPPSGTTCGVAAWNGSSWSAVGNVAADSDNEGLESFDDGSGPALYVGVGMGVLRFDGASWTQPGQSPNGHVHALQTHDDGTGPRLFVGGSFALAGGDVVGGITAWDGQQWSALGLPGQLGADRPLISLESFDDGSGQALFASGFEEIIGDAAFPSIQVGNQLYPPIARWTSTGWQSASYAPGLPVTPARLEVSDLGNGPMLYACTTLVSHWTGSTWSSILPSGTDGPIHAIAELGGDLYVGGSFHVAGSLASGAIARLSNSNWVAMDALQGDVLSMKVFDDGTGAQLYVGGTFQATQSGLPVGYVARWNGSAWSSLGAMSDHVYALHVFDAGTGPALYAAGGFTSAGGVPAQGVARWNGAGWEGVGNGLLGLVRTLETVTEGDTPRLYAAGDFTSSGPSQLGRIARWDGDSWQSLGAGLDGTVNAIAEFADTDGPSVIAGGEFFHAAQTASTHIARWRLCSQPSETFCFGDGTVRPCPCDNSGTPAHGCENSIGTGGARLSATGTIVPDTLLLHANAELPSALSIFLQGDADLTAGVRFGDGVRCAAGHLVRLYVKNAVAGSVTAPGSGDDPITTRSASLGQPIQPGSLRFYQTYYRDPDAVFCPPPAGSSWNVTNGVRVSW